MTDLKFQPNFRIEAFVKNVLERFLEVSLLYYMEGWVTQRKI
jgi:hypothetical protein